MKKVLAVLIALAMLVTFASATTQFDYIKDVYIDPNHFAQLPAGYSVSDGQYSSIKMVAQPDGVATSQSAYSKLEVGTSVTAVSSGSGNIGDSYVQNALVTQIAGTTEGVSKQLIYQNGEIYVGNKPVVYDAQNPNCPWEVQNWAGYSRDQGAVFSGDLDCTDKSFTVVFNDDQTAPEAKVKFMDGLYLTEDMADDMAVQVGVTSGASLGEAFGGMSAGAEVTFLPQQALSQDDMTDMSFEAGFYAGGMADLSSADKVWVNFDPVVTSTGDKKFTWEF
jgi:hypothetical protein